jgi:hypothetical protein
MQHRLHRQHLWRGSLPEWWLSQVLNPLLKTDISCEFSRENEI